MVNWSDGRVVKWSRGHVVMEPRGGVVEVKIERFEDVQAWQEARVLANLVYDVTAKGTFAKDYDLRDQIRAAAGSVMHNIAEGFDAGSDAAFIPFLKYARRSASEVQSEAYLALDRHYIAQDEFQAIYNQATRCKKLINAFIAYLRKSKQPSDQKPPDHLTPDHVTKRPSDHLTN